MTISERFPDRPTDDANTKTLKHGYRMGVLYGAIDPDSDKGRELWEKMDGLRSWHAQGPR